MTQFAAAHVKIAMYAKETADESFKFQTIRTLRIHNSLLLSYLILIFQVKQVTRKSLTSQLFPRRPPWKRSSFRQTRLLRYSHIQLHQ